MLWEDKNTGFTQRTTAKTPIFQEDDNDVCNSTPALLAHSHKSRPPASCPAHALTMPELPTFYVDKQLHCRK